VGIAAYIWQISVKVPFGDLSRWVGCIIIHYLVHYNHHIMALLRTIL